MPTGLKQAPKQRVNKPAGTSSSDTAEDAFGPWMLVSRRKRGSPPQRSDPTQNQNQCLPSGTGKVVVAMASARQSRFAPIEELQVIDDLTRREAREEDCNLGKSTLVKTHTQSAKRNTAGNLNPQKMNIGHKAKFQYKPKQDKSKADGSAHVSHGSKTDGAFGPAHASHVLDNLVQDINPIDLPTNEGGAIQNDLCCDFNKFAGPNSTGPVILNEASSSMDQSKQPIQISDGSHMTSGTMVLHMGSKNSEDAPSLADQSVQPPKLSDSVKPNSKEHTASLLRCHSQSEIFLKFKLANCTRT